MILQAAVTPCFVAFTSSAMDLSGPSVFETQDRYYHSNTFVGVKTEVLHTLGSNYLCPAR